MRFNVLGPLEVLCEGKPCTPTAAKIRWTLALLLLHSNQVVNLSSIIDELWASNSPRSAVTTAQTYIYQLRKKYDRFAENPSAGFIETHAPGYILRLKDDQLDVREFERLSVEGRTLLVDGDAESASRRLRQALGLWRGPVLADLSTGPVLSAHVAHMEETRLHVLQTRIMADVQLGRYRELLPELRSLVIANPLNEWFHEQLIIALKETGRRGDALQAYSSLRIILDEELGIKPTEALRELQRNLLVGDTPRWRMPALKVIH